MLFVNILHVLFETYMLSYLKSNSSQDWVHNLQGIIQNEDVGFLVSRELRVSLPGGGACLKTLLLQRSVGGDWEDCQPGQKPHDPI
jgi:hypothetical protein